ncbi:MAG: hypothetical protein ACI9TY_001650 [Alphaproteobacteria bacterium]|jgi:hypothetical protein
MQKYFKSHIKNQKGAMFGLDARITLAIFSGLSVIAGYTITSNLDYITGGALSDELKNFSAAVDGYHHDLRQDIFKTLRTPSSENAVAALYDNEYITPGRYRARWLGPYVEYRSTKHHKYGHMTIEKRQNSFNDKCKVTGNICYLWASFESVPLGTLQKVNDDYDGNEVAPELEGRIQWDMREDKGNENFRLWYRISRSIL